MSAERISKTVRILSTYHMFRYSREVEPSLLMDSFGISKKTAYRDICALRDAGVLRVRFDKAAGTYHEGAYISMSLKRTPITFSEGTTGRKHSEKIRRLCTFMAELDEAMYKSPVALYRTLFPDSTDRTRQRDFNELRAIGYVLSYGAPTDEEPKYWSVVIPDAYQLETIPEEMRSID